MKELSIARRKILNLIDVYSGLTSKSRTLNVMDCQILDKVYFDRKILWQHNLCLLLTQFSPTMARLNNLCKMIEMKNSKVARKAAENFHTAENVLK